MKQDRFTIWFTNGTYPKQREVVYAFNEISAIILGQAKRIMAGKDFTILYIERI